jgi:hypothetical protein
MVGDVAAALLDKGHEVVVLTARSSYAVTSGVVSASNETKVKVRYALTLGEKHRLLSWVLFLIQAWVRIPFMRWDRCVLLTDPPFLAALSILLRPFPRRLSNVFWWTMDLYPEILVSSGRLRESSPIHAFLRRLNGDIIRRMGGFILLGDCQLQRMRAYPTWQDRNYVIVPPWDRRPIAKVERANNRFLENYGLMGKKVALYAGTLGEGHTFAPLVEAARELVRSQRDDWAIVFVIRGSKKQQLTDAAKGLSSVLILDYQPVEWTSDLLWSAHVHLITMNGQSKGLVVPSKLYGVLQTEAPVLFIGPPGADTAQEIERYHAGETLSEACGGAQVLAALDRLHTLFVAGNADRTAPDRTGPERIATLVTQCNSWRCSSIQRWRSSMR